MQLDRSKLIGAVIAVAVGVAVFALWPRETLTPEDVIKEKVQAMANAAGERDVAAITEEISERFRSDGADKQQIKGIIASQVFRGELVQVWVTDMDVQLESDTRADFQGKFLFARRAAKSVEEAAGQDGMSAYRIDGKLEKESDGEWRFVSAKYQPINATDLF